MSEQVPQIEIDGDGNVIGGGNIVVINKQHFTGEYEFLGDAYIDPQRIFDDVDLDHFVGREWLLDEVDGFFRKHDRGYFILEAEAGLGKTTFLAWLVKKRGYINHFVGLAPGAEGIRVGLQNLAAQLVRTYRLNGCEGDTVISRLGTWPNRIYNLLKQATDQRRDGEKIVLVVDALDEAGTPRGENVLGLPKVLPEGVYFIVSLRPTSVALQVDCPFLVFPLEADTSENLDDMRAYLMAAAARLSLLGVLDWHHWSQFVEALLEKSQGLWIYVYHVVQEILRGDRSPLDPGALPTGVWQYYAQYWFAWREQDKAAWYQKYLPLLATLAAARDALPLKQLCSLAGVEKSPEIGRLLRAEWSPLIRGSEVEGTCRYRLYHASLKEFLSGQAVDSNSMLRGQQSLADELAEAARQAHLRIVDRYLEAWGGLEAGLPRLADPVMRDLDECYGVYHITTHLEMSERVEDLHCLLRIETADHCNAWYVAKETIGDVAGYMSDVERAWLLAEREYDFEDIASTGRNIGLQCRYALVTASLSGLGDIPTALLVALVKWKVWNPEQGVACVSRIPNPLRRGKALAALVSCLPKSLQESAIRLALEALEEGQRVYGAYSHVVVGSLADLAPFLAGEQVLRYGLAVSQEIPYDPDRSRALVNLVKCLAPTLCLEKSLEEVLLIIRRLPTEYAKADVLAKIARVLPASLLNEALTMAHELEENSYDWSPRAMALVGLVPRLPGLPGEDALQEALDALEKLPRFRYGGVHRFPWIEQLLELAPYLPEVLKEELFSDALAFSRWVFPGDLRSCMMLSDLALHLPEPGKGRLLRRAFVGTLIQPRQEDGYGDPYHPRAEGLAYLVPRLGRAGYLKMALKGLRMIERRPKRYCQTVSELAPYLSEPCRGEVLRKALALWRKARRLSRYEPSLDSLKELLWARIRASWDKADMTIPGNDWRLRVPNRLRGSVPDALLRWMISVRRVVGTKRGWAMTLGRLAPYMSDVLLREALAMIQQVEDSWARELALAELAPRLAELDHVQALEAARAMYGESRARAFTGMMGYLPKEIRNQVLQETLEAIEDCEGEPGKKEILMLLLSCPPGQFDLDALKQILPVVMGLEWATNVEPVLKKLVLHLMALPRPTLVRFWAREYENIGFLHVLSRTPRPYSLPCIGALAPVIANLGGPEAAAETFQAIQDVKRWW